MNTTKISNIEKGEYFRLSETGPVWFKNHYDRSLKKYSISLFLDTNHEKFVDGKLIVFVDFDF